MGVAIAIALMPPLSVVGFGIATANATVFTGSLFLFLTNLVTMALTAAIVARLYGFGAQLSPKQTRLQAVIILVGLATFAVPLAFALKQIAWESVAQRQIRDAVIGQFPSAARIAQMDIDFQAEPIDIYAAVLTPSPVDDVEEAISDHLGRSLQQPFTLYVSQIDVGGDRRASEAAQIAAAQESGGLPMTVRDLGDQSLAARCPAMGACHVRLGPGFINEDQPGRIDAILIFAPLGASAAYVRAVLLARVERLFLSVIPSRRKKRLIMEVSAFTPRSSDKRRQSASSVMSGCSQRAFSMTSRCGFSLEGRWPPVPTGARLPVRR